MPKVQLQALDRYSFETEIAVRTTDLNYGGHLGNDRLLSLIHEARVAFLASFGFSELDCGGISLIMADTAVVYLGEAFAGDVLKFEVAAGERARCGFRLFYRVTRISGNTGSGEKSPIALVENGMVGFDYRERSIRPLPVEVAEMCAP